MLISVLSFIVVFGILVLFHEAGHMLVAKLLGAHVAIFSIGFGKPLVRWHIGETEYRVALFPLGGYVLIPALEPEQTQTYEPQQERSSEKLSKGRKAAIFAAGPAASMMGALLLLWAAAVVGVEVPAYLHSSPAIGWVKPGSPAYEAGFRGGDIVKAVAATETRTWADLQEALNMLPHKTPATWTILRDGQERKLTVIGVPEGFCPKASVIITLVQPSSPAAKAGLKQGDTILSVEEEDVDCPAELKYLIAARPGKPTKILVLRGGEKLTIQVKLGEKGGEGYLGVVMGTESEVNRKGPLAAVSTALSGFVDTARLTFTVLAGLLTGKLGFAGSVSGPIGLARYLGMAAKRGLGQLINLAGVISFQLGLLNLIPIPGLDGGHLLLLGVEAVLGREIPERWRTAIVIAGMAFIGILLLIVIYSDLLPLMPEGVRRLLPGGG